MPVYLYLPFNQDHSYLIVSKNSSLLSFQEYSSDITYVFTIDNETGTIFSSSIQNVDVFNSFDEAKSFLSINFNDSKMKMLKLGNFLVGSSLSSPNFLVISVIDDCEKIASIFSHDILKIKNIRTYCLTLPLQNANFDPINNNLSLLNLYFSPSLDLSAPFPYYCFNQNNLRNNNFCFNESFLSEFIDNRLLIACVIVVKGFICSVDNFIYITKFCNCINDSLKKLECECEIIFKREVVEGDDSKPQVYYYSHAWRTGPYLFLENNETKLSEYKKYFSKEIVSRFNIKKVRIVAYIFSENQFMALDDDILKGKLNEAGITVKKVQETQSKIQKLNILDIENELNISEIENELNIPDSNQKNHSLFTILNQNGEITCIQDLIYRFMSSDSLKMTSILTYVFLKKMYQIMKDESSAGAAIKFAMNSFEAGDKLQEYNLHKPKQSKCKNYKKENSDDYFINDPIPNELTKKKFLLDTQHMSFAQNYSTDEIVIAYGFPEPFMICDLYFFVYPMKECNADQDNELTVYIQYDLKLSALFGISIPYVTKPTWLHYNFRNMVKNSYQCPYDHNFFEPTSVVHFTFKVPANKREIFPIKNIKLGVKRHAKHPFKFIIQGLTKSYFKTDEKIAGVNFNAEKRSLLDLVKLSNYRIDKQFPRFSENNKLAINFINPWYYNLRSQLLSLKNDKYCPFCNIKLKKIYSTVKIVNEFDPILLILLKNDDDGNDDDSKNKVKICSECAKHIGNFISKYETEIKKFSLADNSNFVSHSTKKLINPLYFHSKQDNIFDLSRYFTVSNEPVYKTCNLHFSTMVNINSIRIELDNIPKIKEEIKIKVKFNQLEQNIELNHDKSPYIMEKSFTDKSNIHLITFTFSPVNVENFKFSVFGSLSNTFALYPKFENKDCNNNSIEFKDIVYWKKYAYDAEKRIQTFNILFSVLNGIYFKPTNLQYQAKSVAICIKTADSKKDTNFLILPKFEKDSIFYYPFQCKCINVMQVSILYLDCVPRVDVCSISFNGIVKK